MYDEVPDDFNVIATRTACWHAAALEIPNERAIIEWPVVGDDAARIVRLTELCGDVAAAIARGHTDVAGELTKLLAATTIWLEALAQR